MGSFTHKVEDVMLHKPSVMSYSLVASASKHLYT